MDPRQRNLLRQRLLAPSRRELLVGAAGAVGLAAIGRACGGDSPGRRRVGIVGGGIAGVSTAWLLSDAYDVVLFEARAELGGNVRTAEVDVRGQPVAIDIGAQYVHPAVYPTYWRLLSMLGLVSATAPDDAPLHESPSSITVYSAAEDLPRFVSPLPPDRTWPISEAWNAPGVQAFAEATAEARRLDLADGGWDVTVEDWLATLELDADQRERILLPWVASLYTGEIDRAREYSARSALVFVARATGRSALEAPSYYTLATGLRAVIAGLASEARSTTVHLEAPVDAIARAGGGFRLQAGAITERVDLLVLAAPPDVCAALLEPVAGTEAQRAALGGIELEDARLVIHRDPAFAHPDPRYWSFLNSQARDGLCEASMWLASAVVPAPDGQPVDLWKSWVSHRGDPREVLAEARYRHLLPSTASLAAQTALGARQGDGGIYFVGGTKREYEAQETALISAMEVAEALGAESPRLASLREARDGAG